MPPTGPIHPFASCQPHRDGRLAHRPRTGRLATLVLAVAVLGPVTAACGSADGDGRSAAAAGGAFARRRHGAAVDSPLADALGATSATGTAIQREADKQREESIASCMRAQGFSYVPNVAAAAATGASTDDLTERQFAERWGYGWYTSLRPDGSMVDGAPANTLGGAGTSRDPNAAIVAAMTEAERTAYGTALYGARFAEGGSAAGEAGTAETDTASAAPIGGCLGAAMASQGPGSKVARMQDVLMAAENDLRERIAADRREKSALRAYRSCMAAAGFPKIRTPEDVQKAMTDLVGDLYAKHPEAAQRLAEQQAAAASEQVGTGGATGAPGAGAPPNVATDPTVLAEAQAAERKLATAELPCKGAYQLRHEEIAAEYERAYVRDHRSQIDASKVGG